MPILEGRFAWVNQYLPNPRIDRARAAGLKGAIIKYGLREVEQAYTEAGMLWATEVYALPSQPEIDAQRLANAVDAGACAAVINAEVEWESKGEDEMIRLIQAFRLRHPTVELYASVDTRGNRLQLPYQQVLKRVIAGWLPMVYPKAFRPTCPPGFVAAAFRDCLDGKGFGGIPVYPTIQTYDEIGARYVEEQTGEVHRRGLTGYQAYTIAHATDAEWAAIVADEPQEEEMPTLEERVAALEVAMVESVADRKSIRATLQMGLGWLGAGFALHRDDKKPHVNSEALRNLDDKLAGR